jgi:hypothetical protein
LKETSNIAGSFGVRKKGKAKILLPISDEREEVLFLLDALLYRVGIRRGFIDRLSEWRGHRALLWFTAKLDQKKAPRFP